MNIKKYINMILLQLSNKYQFNLIEMTTYKQGKKYRNIKLAIYKYKKANNEDGREKTYWGTIETRNDRELLLKLKEMI